MTGRNIMARNLGWKLLSLFLGILVWYFVSTGIQQGFTPFSRLNTVTFERPVFILTSGQIPTSFEVRPARVNVTVRGRRDVLQRLSERRFGGLCGFERCVHRHGGATAGRGEPAVERGGDHGESGHGPGLAPQGG
jgi:hypothetical protein